MASIKLLAGPVLAGAAALAIFSGGALAGGTPAMAATHAPHLTAGLHRVAAPADVPVPEGTTLQPGQQISSNSVTLVMQTDGNLVLYPNAYIGNPGKALWRSGTSGNNVAAMQYDGNFVIYPVTAQGNPLYAEWESNTAGQDNVLEVQDDGNVVIYPVTSVGASDTAEWQTGTNYY
jgi:hypothetical protein